MLSPKTCDRINESNIISIHLNIPKYISMDLNDSKIFQHIPRNFWQFHHISGPREFSPSPWQCFRQWGGTACTNIDEVVVRKTKDQVFFLFFWIERCRVGPWRPRPRFWVNNVDLVDFLAMFLVLVQVEITGFGMEILIFFAFLGVEFYQIAIGDQHTKTSAIDISLHIWMLYGFVTWAIPVYPQMANLWKMM